MQKITQKNRVRILGILVALALLLVSVPALAQEEEFTWEGDWVIYQDVSQGSITIQIVKDADGSYHMESVAENQDTEQDDWHPPYEINQTVTVSKYRMKIVVITSYQGQQFGYVEWNFERTDNPDQLRGTQYFLSEHQFSGNDLGWNIVDNHIESDITPLCAARPGVSPPDPCMALGADFVPPEEEPAEEEPPAPDEDIQPPEQPQEEPEDSLPETDIQEEPADDQEIPEPDIQAPTTDLSQPAEVSAGAQTAAAVGTTGLLAFWVIWEILSWAPPSGPSNSFINNLTSLFSSPPSSPSQTSTPPPAASQPSDPPPVKSPPYTGPGSKETEIFDGDDVHTILQALELIPPEVKPGDTYSIPQAQLDNLLAGHPDGHPHQITLANGNIVNVDNIQGIAFHGEGDGGEIDFSQGISIVAEVVKPGTAPPPPAPAPASSSGPTPGSGGTPDAGTPPVSSGTGSQPSASPGSGSSQGSSGSDMDLLDQQAADEQELENFFSSTGSDSAGGDSAGVGSSAASGDPQQPAGGSSGAQPDTGSGPVSGEPETEYSSMTAEVLDRKVDELLDELGQSTSQETPAGSTDYDPGVGQDKPQAGMIDSEADNALDDF
ncbi:MAG: hypothetical protein ACK2T7_10605 [Anaerolineales bacterium]